eukprot:12442_1
MTLLALTCLLLAVHVINNAVNAALQSIINGFNIWTSYDMYYRAVPWATVNILYYSLNHSNILDTDTLNEIHAFEQQIKSWPGYHDHSLIYKENSYQYVIANTSSSLYLECPPSSALNYMFPETFG